MKTITKFNFDQAQYIVEDNQGNRFVLKMNYAANSYEIEGGTSELAENIAADLLKKKHAVNFAYKFSRYKLK